MLILTTILQLNQFLRKYAERFLNTKKENKTALKFCVPSDGDICVFQTVNYSRPMSLDCIVVSTHYTQQRV